MINLMLSQKKKDIGQIDLLIFINQSDYIFATYITPVFEINLDSNLDVSN